MVDLSFVDLSEIDDGKRIEIVRYVAERKGVSARELGYTPQLINMIKHGKAKVSDELLKRCLKYLTNEEFVKIVGKESIIEKASIDDLIKVIKTAQVDSRFRELLFQYIERYLGEYFSYSSGKYIVTKGDLEEFVKKLKSQGRSNKTTEDHLRNLRDVLSRIDFILTRDKINELIYELREDGYSEYQIRDRLITLKKFIKEVVLSKDPYIGRILYDSFRIIKPKSDKVLKDPYLTIEDIRRVWIELPSIESKAYLLLLAGSGLRPGKEIAMIKLQDVDWENRIIWIGRLDPHKKAYFTFLKKPTAKWFREVYLPYRNKFVEEYVSSIKNLPRVEDRSIGDWRNRLIPFDLDRLRIKIKETVRKVLSIEIDSLYIFRKFFETYLAYRGVSPIVIDILSGRKPPTVLQIQEKHYILRHVYELRKIFDEHAPEIIT